MESCSSWWIYLWTVSLLGLVSSDLRSYTIHPERVNFDKALRDCSPNFLTPVSTKQEASDIRELISSSLSGSEQRFTFWVGLRKDNHQCVFPKVPLRGFKWTVDGSQQVEEDWWGEEPQLTCTTILCAALSGEFDGSSVKNWSLVPSTCKTTYPFICKHRDTDKTPETKPEPGPEPGYEPEPGPEPGYEPEPGPEPGSGPEPGPKPGSGPEPGSGPGPEPGYGPETGSGPEPGSGLTSPPQLPPGPTDNSHIGLTESSSLSGVLIPVLMAVMVLVVLVVLVVAVVKCCLMRRSKKRAMKKAEKMAMKSKEAASRDSIETANEKEAT